MGWGSGSEIAEKMATAIKTHVSDPGVRESLYVALVDALTEHDWDCQEDVLGIDPILDKVIDEDLHGPDGDDDDAEEKDGI